MGFCKIRLGLMAAVLAFTAACGDSGPSEFDAVGMQADLGLMDQLEADSTLNNLLLAFDGISSEFDGGLVLAQRPSLRLSKAGSTAAGRAVESFFQKRAAPAISASLASIPPEVAGKTYIYDPEASDWVASELTGAPANGVRFKLYATDVFGDLVLPLVETGHVDLTDLSNGSTHRARLVAVSGGQTKADYTAEANGDADNGHLNVGGFLGEGQNRLNFELDAEGQTSGDNVTFTLSSMLEAPNRDILLQVDLSGTSNDVTETYTGTLEQLIETPNGRVELTGTVTPETNLAIRVNGDLYATYTGDGETLIGAGGHVLTTDEQEALFGCVFVLEYTVFVPIMFMTPLLWVVGDVPGIF